MAFFSALLGFVETHVLAIVVALVLSYVIGFSWHGPIFGKKWMAYNNMTPPKKEDMKFSMMLPGIVANLFMVFVQSAVLGVLIAGVSNIVDALMLALVLWIPFTALTILNSYTWEGKKIGHMCLTAGYYLVITLMIATVMFYMM